MAIDVVIGAATAIFFIWRFLDGGSWHRRRYEVTEEELELHLPRRSHIHEKCPISWNYSVEHRALARPLKLPDGR